MKFLQFLKTFLEYLILFCIGGVIYYIMEVLWRGYSHPTMFLVGGLCFIFVGLINRHYEYDMAILSQIVIAGLIITAVEFISGILLNKVLNLNIWNYTDYTLLGQISTPYMYLWQWLSLVAIFLDDYTRYFLFKEQKPKYKLI